MTAWTGPNHNNLEHIPLLFLFFLSCFHPVIFGCLHCSLYCYLFDLYNVDFPPIPDVDTVASTGTMRFTARKSLDVGSYNYLLIMCPFCMHTKCTRKFGVDQVSKPILGCIMVSSLAPRISSLFTPKLSRESNDKALQSLCTRLWWDQV